MRKFGIILAILCALALGSVLFAQEDGTTTVVTVPATTNGWIGSGVTFNEGDIFTISAGGAINLWPNCESNKVDAGLPDFDCSLVAFGPAGTTGFDPAEMDYPFPGGNVGGLVARVGAGDTFLVGVGGTFSATQAGELQFAINDIQDMGDNQGEFLAIVGLPEPLLLVPSNGIWLNTGTLLTAGDTLNITATGTINIWPNCEETKAEQGYPDLDCALVYAVAPNGLSIFPPAEAHYPMPGAPVGALVGKIGEDGVPFLIGAGGSFIIEGDGELWIAVNDTTDFSVDDEGFFNVVINSDNIGVTVYVPGTVLAWQPTGMMLAAGESLTIQASGILDIWPNCEETKAEQGLPDVDCSQMHMGPTGTTELELAPEDYPLPGGRIGAFVGRSGTDGTPFLIGNGGTFTSEVDAELFIHINDIQDMGDNRGGFVATVTREGDAPEATETP